MIEPHSLNGRLLPVAMEAFSSLSVTIWNNSSATWVQLHVTELVEAQEVKTPVAGDDTTEPAFVGRLHQLVHRAGRR